MGTIIKKKVRQDIYPDQHLNPMPRIYKSDVTRRRDKANNGGTPPGGSK
jgi:hypothetical protein